MNKILFFDTETTGLPKNYKAPVEDIYNWPSIVQLAYIMTNEKGDILLKNMSIVNPGDVPIAKQAAETHGISEELAKQGLNDYYAIGDFYTMAKSSDLLVAHNYNFDSKVLMSLAHKMNRVDYDILRKQDYLCTMEASTKFCAIPGPYGKYKWPKLQELYFKIFGEEFEGAHDALYDVEAMVKCYFKLKELEVII